MTERLSLFSVVFSSLQLREKIIENNFFLTRHTSKILPKVLSLQ